MKDICGSAFCFIVQVCRLHQGYAVAVGSSACRHGIEFFFDMADGFLTVFYLIFLRNSAFFPWHPQCLCQFHHVIHDNSGQLKKLSVTGFVIPCQNKIYLLCCCHEFSQQRHGFWGDAVKAVNPDMISLYQLRLIHLLEKQIDIIL